MDSFLRTLCNGALSTFIYFLQQTQEDWRPFDVFFIFLAGIRIQHFSTDPDPAGKKNADPDPTLNRNEEKNIFIF